MRIAGFKSFAEPVSVEIHAGLTGIVGPNGCGKSNVVEALRWAMGEQSTRSLRAGEMDDVIFAGTAGRASRNLAEVTLTLDDTAGAVPPPFHEQSELEIVRRIERGSGSDYRVNGKEVRARDVQTLFADLATGAHASGMVSQGRVGALVTAKPEDRRAVLEEAAGITGLHVRRHEAELKLRAAETNLARADDLRGQLEVQLGALKRQARQASRYRNISGAIRQAEAEFLTRLAGPRRRARAEAEAALGRGARRRKQPRALAGRAARVRAAVLPILRETDRLNARTALERHRLAQEQMAEAERRARADLANPTAAWRSLDRTWPMRNSSAATPPRRRNALAGEDTGLTEADAATPTAAAAESTVVAAIDAIRRPKRSHRATEAAAEANARVQTAARQLTAAVAAPPAARTAFGAAHRARSDHAQTIDPVALETAGTEQGPPKRSWHAPGTTLRSRFARRPARRLAAARERHTAADATHAKLAAEARALAEVLAVKDGERWPPMVDALGVPAGLETALGAALGEELTSAADHDAARHWRELPPFDPAPKLPGGATPLAALVQAPPALARVLSQTGLVEDAASAKAAGGSRPARCWSHARAPSGAGTATPSAPARRPRRPSGCSNATGYRAAAELEDGTKPPSPDPRPPANKPRRQSMPRSPPSSRPARHAPTRNARWSGRGSRRSSCAPRPTQPRPGSPPWSSSWRGLNRIVPRPTLRWPAHVKRVPPCRTWPPCALRSKPPAPPSPISASRNPPPAPRGMRLSATTTPAPPGCAPSPPSAPAGANVPGTRSPAWSISAHEARKRAPSTPNCFRRPMPSQRSGSRRKARCPKPRPRIAVPPRPYPTRKKPPPKPNPPRAPPKPPFPPRARPGCGRNQPALRPITPGAPSPNAFSSVWAPTRPCPTRPKTSAPEAEEKARKRHERLLKERDEMGPVNLRADIEAEETEKQIATIDQRA